MNIISKIINSFKPQNKGIWQTKLVSEFTNGVYSWNGDVYKSDIARSCIRPYAKAIGKLEPVHYRTDKNGNPAIVKCSYVSIVLQDPNPYMSGQMLFEKLATQQKLNHNAFAYLYRDKNGYVQQILPISAYGVRAKYDEFDNLYLEFNLRSGKIVTFPYSDVLHLREDFSFDDIFGDSPGDSLKDLMNLVGTIDNGFIKAINNGGILRWLLKFKQGLTREDLKIKAHDFVNDYLKVNGEDSEVAAAADSKTDIEQLKPTDYNINSSHMTRVIERLYSFFGTNQKIVQGSYNEDEWRAYYESEIEPFALQLGNELTRKFFTRKERSQGEKIVLSAASLSTASLSTLLNLVQMVDRGAMTPNEWRRTINLSPIDGGDEPIRRLDTAAVKEINNNEK